MYAMYVWAFVLFHLTRLAGWLLLLFMRAVPNRFSPRSIPMSKLPVNIVEAGAKKKDNSVEDVSNKLAMFISAKWGMLDGKPSVSLDKLAETMNWAILWICYIQEVDLNGSEKAEKVCIKAIDFVEKITQKYEGREFVSEQSTFGRYSLD